MEMAQARDGDAAGMASASIGLHDKAIGTAKPAPRA